MSELNEMYLGIIKPTCIHKKLNGYKQQDMKNKISFPRDIVNNRIDLFLSFIRY